MKFKTANVRVVFLLLLVSTFMLVPGVTGTVSAGPADATEPTPVVPPIPDGCGQPSGDEALLLLGVIMAIGDALLF